MTSRKLIFIAAGVVALAIAGVVFLWPAGARGPEAIAHGKDACDRCRMLIAQPGFAAELRDRQGRMHKYDDLGCFFRGLAELGGGEAWVEDRDDGALLEANSATFVKAERAQTPMGYGIVAFRDPARAKAFADEQGGRIVRLADLIPRGVEPVAASTSQAPLAAKAGEKRPLTPADVRAGKDIYLRECSACHGERGDGAGPAAAFLPVPPRNFLKQKFRLRTTPSGSAPATGDVLRTIERGIPGSGMPSFAFLSEDERRQVAAYVLDRANQLEKKEPQAIQLPSSPPPPSDALLAAGKATYQKMGCAKCHGDGGRGDGVSAPDLKDDLGRPIKVRDLTTGVFRGGDAREDIYYRYTAGMDGTPMPSFETSIPEQDRWALADYVKSLRRASDAPPPSDPIAAGRATAEKYACRGCHVLDDGKGGEVGPDLRVSAQKLDPRWVRTFLSAPREWGKIYPWRQQRMPHLGLTKDEVEVMTKYLLAIAKRKDVPTELPDPATFPEERLAEGQLMFMLRCTECHTLGDVIPTPYAKQQGPDLLRVVGRVDYDWAHDWISDPKKIDPKTRMTVPGITPEQADSVRMFIWKTAIEHGRRAASVPGGR